MPHPFDATLKELVQSDAADFAPHFGFGSLAPLRALNVDLSLMSAATDVALGHGDPLDVVIDINFQSNRDDRLDSRILLYNAALHHRYRVPVHSAIVLLRPKADSKSLSGKLRYDSQHLSGKLEFNYHVVRLWQIPVEQILKGGLAALALAPLCQMPHDAPVQVALPTVLDEMVNRLNRDAKPAQTAKILTGAYVLAGLRMTPDEARNLFRRNRAVEESTTFQAILDEGEVRGLHYILLKQGKIRFGSPSKDVKATIEGIDDLAKLRRMAERVVTVSSWEKLLGAR